MEYHYNDKYYEFYYAPPVYEISPHPYLEIRRNELWNDIQNDIISILRKNKIRLRSGNKKEREILSNDLAMWIARNITEDTHLKDPFFPHNAKYNDVLINNFVDNGKVTKNISKKLVREINLPKKCNDAIKILSNTETRKFEITRQNDNIIYTDKEIIRRTYCPDFVYRKMKKSFHGKEKDINKYIFMVLLRYDTLGGRAHQFAMDPKFKEALRKKFNVNFECFASAINNYYPMFGSLFYDVEEKFGSFGSFYNIKYIKGFFIANPPYEEDLLLVMVKKFINSIKKSEKNLSISFGLPRWGKYRDFKALEIAENSKYTEYYRCFNREVYWYDTLTNYKIVIPEHCRFVVTNEADIIDDFDSLAEIYWVAKSLKQEDINVSTKEKRLYLTTSGLNDFNEKKVFLEFEKKELDFPYLELDKKELDEKIKTYRKNKFYFEKEEYENDYNDILFYFIEKYLVNCNFNSTERSLIKNFKLWGNFLYEKNNNNNFREYIYKNINNCFDFNTKFNLAVLDHYLPKKILDYNMGFGDKLLASVIRNVKYTGFLEQKIENNLNDIIKNYGDKNRQIIINNNFNKYNLDEKFDLIFTKINEYENIFFKNDKNIIKKYVKDKNKYILMSIYMDIFRSNILLLHNGKMILEINNDKYIDIISLFILNNYSHFNMILDRILERGDDIKYMVFVKKASFFKLNRRKIENDYKNHFYNLYFYSNKLIQNIFIKNFMVNNLTYLSDNIIRDSGNNSLQNKVLLLSILSKPNYINKFIMYGSMKTSEIVLVFAKICQNFNLKCSWAIYNNEYGWENIKNKISYYSQVIGNNLQKSIEYGLTIERIEDKNLYHSTIDTLEKKLYEKYHNKSNVHVFPFNILENDNNILIDVISNYYDIELTHKGTIFIPVNTIDYILALSTVYKYCNFIVLVSGKPIDQSKLDTKRMKFLQPKDINTSGTIYSYNTGPEYIVNLAKKFDIEVFSAWMYDYYLEHKKEGDICIFYD